MTRECRVEYAQEPLREHSTFISLHTATIRSTISDVGDAGVPECADETMSWVKLSPKVMA